MTITTTTLSTVDAARRPSACLGSLVYRFVGSLGELNPLGVFSDGIRFHNDFTGEIIAGPFAGGRIYGLDQYLQRPDGVGEIRAPEVIESGSHRVGLEVRGFVVPPEDAPVPSLQEMLAPDFEFPDVPFRVTGSALAATTSLEFGYLNRTTIVIEGQVNLRTGRLEVEARAVEPIGA